LPNAANQKTLLGFLKFTFGFCVNNWRLEMNESTGLNNNSKEREDYECPECGEDCGDMERHTVDDIHVLYYFTCEKCGIDFGGDL
jgi:hypothetical protein